MNDSLIDGMELWNFSRKLPLHIGQISQPHIDPSIPPTLVSSASIQLKYKLEVEVSRNFGTANSLPDIGQNVVLGG